MPEGFVQVAPDSTGARIRTRERTISSQVVDEQYVIIQNEMVAINRAWLSTLRVPNPAVTAPVAPAVANVSLFAVWNGIASGGNNVNCRRLSVEIDSVLAHTAASPILRLYRMSAAPSGGTLITPEKQYSVDPALNTLVAIRAAHGTDNVVSALTAGTVGAQSMWSQTAPRMHTAAGFQVTTEYNLMPNDSALITQDPLILRPQEGFVVRLETTTALAAGVWTFSFKAVLAEFTYP